MDLNYIREFTVFAKYRNLSEAAIELYTTQPVLSKHLNTLEKELGVTLFDRHTNPMQLTYAGEVFMEESCALLARYHRVIARTKEAYKGEDKTETLVIGGLTNSAVLSYCLKAEQLYHDNFHSVVCIKREQHAYNTAKNLLLEGKLDISLEIYSKAMEVAGLKYAHLLTDDAVVVVEKTHPLAARESVMFRELEQETHVTLNNNVDYSLREFTRLKCEEFGFVGGLPFNFAFKNALTYQQMLLQGLDGGILVLPKSSCDFFPVFSLESYAVVPIVDENFKFDICAMYRADAPAKVTNFLQMLTQITSQEN